jgi:hypothetical protein
MRVDVQDRELRMYGPKSAQHRIGDRMIAAEDDGPAASREHRRHTFSDDRAWIRAVRKHQIAGIVYPAGVHAQLGPRVAGRGPEGVANQRRAAGRAAQKR